ncbi:sigma-54 interaction domain-containing protein [Plebeiibacterium sediminum]|uniref:Sigma 54-interacting transcriptional regulator n=1 Tax=Plebeiibacterium sediminum TaxID=2992112 RepID=A0AAE3MA01_9BACT|nr:sigma 54-interacting transcriptional regulator [Plebeiobacterium sediminum]MCW3789687.1 sigma 54-interacting transcriptional regulator [Plebeiobacterium sediminum]
MAANCIKGGSECYGLKEMTLLFEISQRLIASTELKNDLSPILKMLVDHLEAERSFLTIYNRNNSSIYIEAAYGMSPKQQSLGKYQLGEGVIGKVVELGQPIVIQEISKSNLFLNKTRSDLRKEGRELTFICIPIVVENKMTGALSVVREFNPHIPYEEDIHFLSIIGSLIAKTVKVRQQKVEELEELKQKNIQLQTEVAGNNFATNIIGNSSKMRDVFSLVEMVAPTNSTVLIRGESGIGKELIADAIHTSSSRKNKNLIKVNCSALPDSLIESELFGHEKGAFTGADQMRKGRFEMANGGTIFLDEIGDLPLSTQVKLLRVIQEREFERLGGTETIAVDVRIVCATNCNLEQLIEDGEFREDLFYRINVFPIFVPALRERRNDIPLLVDHFIQKFNKKNKANIKRITTSAIDMLMMYRWPGNVRELENVIERACILSRDNVVHGYHLPPTLQTASSTATGSNEGMTGVLERLEKQLIIDGLISSKGNITKAAESLKITERMLGTRIKKYKIDAWRYKV